MALIQKRTQLELLQEHELDMLYGGDVDDLARSTIEVIKKFDNANDITEEVDRPEIYPIIEQSYLSISPTRIIHWDINPGNYKLDKYGRHWYEPKSIGFSLERDNSEQLVALSIRNRGKYSKDDRVIIQLEKLSEEAPQTVFQVINDAIMYHNSKYTPKRPSLPSRIFTHYTTR